LSIAVSNSLQRGAVCEGFDTLVDLGASRLAFLTAPRKTDNGCEHNRDEPPRRLVRRDLLNDRSSNQVTVRVPAMSSTGSGELGSLCGLQ
jgi:hypothetical protein